MLSSLPGLLIELGKLRAGSEPGYLGAGDFDELSFDEIAGRLGVKASTARSLLRHGLDKIRAAAVEAGHIAH